MTKYEFNEIQRNTLENLNIPMVIYQYIDKKVFTLLVTNGMCKLMSMDRQEIIDLFNSDMYRDTHPDDKARVADAALKFASGGDKFDVVYRTMSHVLNDYVIVHSHGEHFFTEEGIMLSSTVYIVEGVGADLANPLTEKLASNYQNLMTKESLIRDNFYDTLTGLPNMSYFLQLADAGKLAIFREQKKPVILFMDLTGMKYFNEKYGLREGDILLVEFANILKKHFHNENCGRMGQDHFAAFTDEVNLQEKLNSIFDEMRYANDGRTLPVHVGIYEADFEDVSSSTGLDRAKIVCDMQKGTYSSVYAYYTKEVHEQSKHYDYVLNTFEDAIKNGWIRPYYQQIVRSVNGLVCDEEALARWEDPVKGLIPTEHFIYVLEDAKLIHKLDLYILECVLRDLEDVIDNHEIIVPVSINLSKYDFELCDMVEEIAKRVKASRISTDFITVEITESVSSLDPDFLATQIDRFHKAGFKVWMDDFGSGYSSLNLLQKFDFDLIKFDMRFMREFNFSKKNHVIINELIQMTKKLNIDTVVEGVETIEQVKFLREIGCNKMQGFYFAKPITLEEWYDIYRARVGNKIESIEEREYYEIISQTNVVEPTINKDYNWDSDSFFGQMPTGVLEFRLDSIYVMRYNKNFAEFLLREHYIEEIDLGKEMIKQRKNPGDDLLKAVMTCKDLNKWEMVENLVLDKMSINLFARLLSINPVTKFKAFEVVIVSVRAND